MSNFHHYKNRLRIFKPFSVLLLLGMVILNGGYSSLSWAKGTGPEAYVKENVFDFGKIFEDQALTHNFTIENTGSAPLKIEDVDPDCACTVASYDKTIPPGGKGAITLTIKPFSVLHQFKKETTVTVNDPQRPRLQLVMTGVAMPFIEIKPSHIVRLKGSPGEAIQGQVQFISHLPTPWQITEYRTNIPDKIDVTLNPVVPGKEYILNIRNKSREAGPYAGLVELFTNSKERPRLIVRVFGELYLPSAGGQ